MELLFYNSQAVLLNQQVKPIIVGEEARLRSAEEQDKGKTPKVDEDGGQKGAKKKNVPNEGNYLHMVPVANKF